MTPGGHNSSSCTIMRVLKFCALISSLANIAVVVVCLVTGQWVFGATMCQMFGFFSHVAVGGTAWLVALACLERYYKLLLPAEHQGVFSDINVKVIAFGVFFLVAVILANPLYGWGEFSELRGYFHLTVQISNSRDNAMTPTKDTPLSATNDSIYIYSTNCYSNSSIIASGIPFFLNITTDFRNTWRFQSRVMRITGNEITFAMRANNQTDFSEFVSAFHEEVILKKLTNADTCDRTVDTDCLCSVFVMREDDVDQYKNIHIPFQELKVCSVDFTTINNSNVYFVLMFVCSTAVAPYLTVFVLCAMMYFRLDMMAYGFSKEDWIKTRRTFMGCMISVCFYAPYFIVNIMNSRGVFVSVYCHIVAIILYYTCALIPCVFCLQVSCLQLPASMVDSRSIYHENADIELLQMNRV